MGHNNEPIQVFASPPENHTKTRYIKATSRKYQEAWERSQEDKAHLIEILGQQDETPQRLFFPKENRNGPPLRIDNLEFMGLDNAFRIEAD